LNAFVALPQARKHFFPLLELLQTEAVPCIFSQMHNAMASPAALQRKAGENHARLVAGAMRPHLILFIW